MEEKKDDSKTLYICIGAAAILGYTIGKKRGYKKYENELVKNWRKVNFGNDLDLPLYYPKCFEREILHFFQCYRIKNEGGQIIEC